MNVPQLRKIYKYGALLSIVGTATALVAYAVNGQNSVIGLFFGWAGPLGVFFFGGAYLSQSTPYHVAGEELLRGIVWYFGSLLGWSVIVTQASVLSATPTTVFGLPALTAFGIVLLMIGTRRTTGYELKTRTEDGQLLQLIIGGIIFGFLALFLVLAGEVGWWFFGLYLVSIPVGLAIRKVMKQRYPGAFGTVQQ